MKSLLLVAMLAIAGASAAGTRQPAVAGAFYTDDPVELRRQVTTLLATAPPSDRAPRAVVVPHAGYVFSGAVAAKAFAALEGSEVHRVILLGPSHHVGFGGGALPPKGTDAFATPLGDVAVDTAAVSRLRERREFQGPSDAHRPEHSLEVQLPFLQVVAPNVKIVPVLVGYDTERTMAQRMAEELSGLLDDHTVVVVSSDFTHHGARYGYQPFEGDPDPGGELLRLGRDTAGLIAAADALGFWYQEEVSGDTVCGRRPITVLLELLTHAFEGHGKVLDVTTSGHLTGDFSFSVTYAAIRLDGAWHEWRASRPASPLGRLSEDERHALLGLARATLASHLGHDGSLARWFSQHPGEDFGSLAGAFVTVHNTGQRARREGKLRACMGVIDARQPLLAAVVQASVSAAHDPRFPELGRDELETMELEVSVLSPTRRVEGPQAIVVGTHGVVLSKGRRRAVFLPQVATEQGWDRDTMLDHLAVKAGLPSDAWREGAVFEVFTAQVFSEES